jgi:hypothetical protein
LYFAFIEHRHIPVGVLGVYGDGLALTMSFRGATWDLIR